MVARSRTQGEKWSRWIGGGVLALALVGLLAPATTSARVYQDQTPEVIEVEGEAPWTLPNWGGHTGGARRTVRRAGTVEAGAEAGASPAGEGQGARQPHSNGSRGRNKTASWCKGPYGDLPYSRTM
jgi:hypothetical protein